MTENHKVETLFAFVLGAGVGAAIALLLAPKSGAELRGDIADEVGNEVNQIRRTGKNLKLRVQKAAEMAQDHLQSAVEAGEEAYDQAKKE
jgi:gas vesicle protein